MITDSLTYTIGTQSVSVRPFVYEWDYAISRKGDNEPNLAYPNYNYYFTTYMQNGDIIDIKPMLKEKWKEYKDAGVLVSGETFTAINYTRNNQTVNIEYTLQYNPSNPFVLVFTPATQGGYTPPNLQLNYGYESETIWEQMDHCFCWYIIKMANMPGDQYNGEYIVNLWAFRTTYNYHTVMYHTTTLADMTIDTELYGIYEAKTLRDLEHVDGQLHSTDIVHDVDDYCKANKLALYAYTPDPDYPDDPPYAGYSTFYTFDTLIPTKVNGDDVDFGNMYDPIEDPDDDPTPPSSFGGTGYDVPTYPIGFPRVPTYDILDTGFIHAYTMNSATAMALSSYMLTDNFITNVKKLMANPIDYLMSVMFLPVTPPNTTDTIYIGGLNTNITAGAVSSQYGILECGKITVPKRWNGFADFSTTKISIYLPFIGMRQMAAEEVMGSSLELKYYVDYLSGACIAMVRVNQTVDSATKRKMNSVVYHYNGMMGMNCPVTATNYGQKLQSVLSGAVSTTAGVASGNIAGTVSGAISMIGGAMMRPTIDRTGAIAGDAGMMGSYQPYLLIEYPAQALPGQYKNQKGFSSFISGTVSSFSGYLEVDTIKLNGVNCTQAEREEILTLMESGVFV